MLNLIIPLFCTISAVIAGLVLTSIELADPANSLLVVILVCLLFLTAILSAFYLVVTKSIERAVNDRLPPIVFIKDSGQIIKQAVSIVNESSQFLYMTGSATRNISYLDRIERKVSTGIKHVRILYERHTKPEFDHHLHQIIQYENAEILYADEAHHGYFTISEKAALLVLPGRTYPESIAILFSGQLQIQTIKDQFETLARGSEAITNTKMLKETLESIAPFGN